MSDSPLSPDMALVRLMAGNRRFAEQRMIASEENLEVLRRKTLERQEPFATVLACSDSRVPVEMIFDQTIGRIFVIRVAGNVASSDVIASAEFGVAVLGTPVVMALGHSGCGAIRAALAGEPVPGQISTLFPYIRAAVVEAGPDPAATSKANARNQAALLADASPVIRELVAKGAVKVVAAFYDLATGKVTLLD